MLVWVGEVVCVGGVCVLYLQILLFYAVGQNDFFVTTPEQKHFAYVHVVTYRIMYVSQHDSFPASNISK